VNKTRWSRTDPGVGFVVGGRLETVQEHRLDRVAQSIRLAVATTEQCHADPLTYFCTYRIPRTDHSAAAA